MQKAALIAFAVVCFLGEGIAAAKPRIRVSVVFESAAEEFWRTIDNVLPTVTGPTDAEARAAKHIRDALIGTLNKLGMFTFDDSPESPHTLTLTITTNEFNPWPCRPVTGTITTSFPGPEVPIELAPGETEARGASFYASNLADLAYFKRKFTESVQTWTPGFLQGVVLTDKARYKDGKVTLPLPLEELGHMQLRPTAFFEVEFEGVQRHFVLCRKTPTGSEGDDHTGGEQARDCARRLRITTIPSGVFGTVRLFRGFL